MPKLPAVVGAAGVCAVANPIVALADVPIREIARSYMPAPGALPGSTYNQVGVGAIDPLGRVGFGATLWGLPQPRGIWMSDPSNGISHQFLGGSDFPDTPPGLVWTDAPTGNSVPQWDSTGQLAFAAQFTLNGAGGGGHVGVWRGQPGAPSLLARTFQQAPGTADGVQFELIGPGTFPAPRFAMDGGRIAFNARLFGPGVDDGNRTGIWATDGGGLRLIARAGEQPPGYEPGSVFAGFSQVPRVATNGRLVFVGQAFDAGGLSRPGLWTELGGETSLLFRRGDQAPGLSPGVTFSSFGDHVVTGAGVVGLRAGITGPGITPSDNIGVWIADVSRGENPEAYLLARDGDRVPGMADGVTYLHVRQPQLDESGRVAYSARIGGPGVPDNSLAVWLRESDGTRLVLREGQVAPHLGSATITRIAEPYLMNNNGQMAFQCTLDGPGFNTSNNQAIYATDPEGNIVLVAKLGELLEYAPGESALVTQLLFSPSEFGGGRAGQAFNDAGELAFLVTLQGIDSMLVVATIPAPGPAALLLAAGCGAARRRRR